MKLTRIDITNTLGVRRLDVDLNAPLLLVAGRNGAGKTSLLQAVRYALTGAMPRVSLKKDAGQLVSDGAKTGSIGVTWKRGVAPDTFVGEAIVTLPDCKLVKGESGDLHPVMPFLCDMHAFANAGPDDRRGLLFGLTGTSATADDVRAHLIDRGADPKKADAIIPLLRAGFPAAHKEAASRATEAKGAWRGVTGETYGAKKAEGWQAPEASGATMLSAADYDGLLADLEKLVTDLEAEIKTSGQMEAQTKARAALETRIETLREQAKILDRATTKLAHDRKCRDELRPVLEEARRHAAGKTTPMTCPDCGALLVVNGSGELEMRQPGDDTAAEAAASLPEYENAFGMVEKAVVNSERDVAAATAAAAQLAAAEQELAESKPCSREDIEASEELVDSIRQKIANRKAEIEIAKKARAASSAAAEKNANAARHHADVTAWTLIADALAPDGIPGELLAQALKPINDLLAQSAADTDWPPVTIDADMTIRYGGRLYALISESEQWRADAILTTALANLSGVKLALIDRLDVLEIPARGVALGWFDTLADAGEIDTLIVAGTLKSLPGALPKTYQAVWLENGAAAADSIKEAA